MSIDFSNISSIQSYLTQFGAGVGATTNPTANFSDYFMQAIDQSKATEQQKETNGLYDLFAGSANSSAMQGLLGLGDNNILTQYLQGSGTSVNSLTGSSTNMNGINSATDSTADLFSNYLQSNFQAKVSSTLTSAKSQLQVNLEAFKAEHIGNDNELVKLRMNQMEQNVSLLDNYLAGNTTSSTGTSTSSTNDQLMQHLNNNAAYSKFLYNQNV